MKFISAVVCLRLVNIICIETIVVPDFVPAVGKAVLKKLVKPCEFGLDFATPCAPVECPYCFLNALSHDP